MGVASLTASGALSAVGASGSAGVASISGLAPLSLVGRSGSIGVAALISINPSALQVKGRSGSMGVASLGVIPPPPTCINLWSADGRLNWSADGYPGWSADGYEPTPLECAVTYFAEVGVNVGQLTYAYSQTVPLGWVITGYVPFINPVYAGQYIPLVISLGPPPPPTVITVPNVVGLFYYDAQLALLDAGLLIGQPIWALSSTVLPQYVISQSVAPGTQFTQQTQVLITVSGFRVTNQPSIVVPVP
jgi:hypothetical protein